MVKHLGLGEEGELWLPPGGGMEWGQSAADNLQREFLEETGLVISIDEFLFVHEHLKGPLHAVELFFRVSRIEGLPLRGIDPEMHPNEQIISEVCFMDYDDIQRMSPKKLHSIFRENKTLESLFNAKGYFKFEN